MHSFVGEHLSQLGHPDEAHISTYDSEVHILRRTKYLMISGQNLKILAILKLIVSSAVDTTKLYLVQH